MSLDRSLKTKPAALNQHRNVLTRARIARLMVEERFRPGEDCPLGIVKVASRQVVTKKKKKKEDEAGGDAEATPAS